MSSIVGGGSGSELQGTPIRISPIPSRENYATSPPDSRIETAVQALRESRVQESERELGARRFNKAEKGGDNKEKSVRWYLEVLGQYHTPETKLDPYHIDYLQLTESFFQTIKGKKDYVRNFLLMMPKVNMHAHLTGEIWSEDYFKAAISLGLYYDSCFNFYKKFDSHELFYDPKRDEYYTENERGLIPASDHFGKDRIVYLHGPSRKIYDQEEPLKCASKMAGTYSKDGDAFKDACSIRGKRYSGKKTDGRYQFFYAFQRFEGIAYFMNYSSLLEEKLFNNLKDNIVYEELMVELKRRMIPFDLDFSKGLTDKLLDETYKQLNDWVDQTVAQYRREYDVCDYNISEKLRKKKFTPPLTGKLRKTEVEHTSSEKNNPDNPSVIRYIVDVSRVQSTEDFFVEMMLAMAIVAKDERFRGITISGPEDDYLAREEFDNQMKIIEFLRPLYGYPKMNIHAGEVTRMLVKPQDCDEDILKALKFSDRLGHCISVKEQKDVTAVYEGLKKCCVEVCLSSNKHILGIKNGSHPVLTFLEKGIPISPASDDGGVNRSSLSREYLKFINRGYINTYSVIKQCVYNGVDHAFLPSKEKEYLRKRMNKEFKHFESVVVPSLMSKVNRLNLPS